MSVRFLLATVLGLTIPVVANAADPSAGTPASATTTSEPQVQAQVQARRPDRVKPVPSPQQQRRRTIEAPNAALMLIPASYTCG